MPRKPRKQALIGQEDAAGQQEEGERKEEDGRLYQNFVRGLAPVTKTNYTRNIKYFLHYLDLQNGQYSGLVDPNKDKKMIEAEITGFLNYLREEKGISYDSAKQYFNPIKKFYNMNTDFDFNWERIRTSLGNDDDDLSMMLGKKRKGAGKMIVEDDRAYQLEEIQKMIETANDIRVKIMILLMASSGVRHQVIPELELGHLQKNEKYNLYQIMAYPNSKKYKYITFCTPECAEVIDKYLEYRKHVGEELDEKSPLIREQFDANDSFQVRHPRKISESLVRYLVNQVLTKYSALRTKIPYDKKNRRKEDKNSTMLTHGFRKFFDTESRKAGVYGDYVDKLRGSKLQNTRSHYFTPQHLDLFEGTPECRGYRYAIARLTIGNEARLAHSNSQLQKEVENKDYQLQKQVIERDVQIQSLQEQVHYILESMEKYQGMKVRYQKRILGKDFKKMGMYVPSEEFTDFYPTEEEIRSRQEFEKEFGDTPPECYHTPCNKCYRKEDCRKCKLCMKLEKELEQEEQEQINRIKNKVLMSKTLNK